MCVRVLGAFVLGAQKLLPAAQQIYNSWTSIKGNSASVLDLKKVLVSDTSKDRGVSKDLFTDNFNEILNDDSIDLVIEVIGGVDPGKEYIKSLLQKGKAVITANKDIIADCGQELITLAEENNTCLYFEAAVAAGIPVLKPLIESLRGE